MMTRKATAASPRRAALLAALFGLAAACGQEDPTFRPDGGVVVEKGAIAVTSSVPGAAITLDSTPTGRVTPDTLGELSVGLHRVGVFLGGYYPQGAEIEVAADSVHAAHFELDLVEGAGSIAVEAPYPAAILVDGVATGLAAPDTVEGIASGGHTLTLALPGFRSDPREQRVTVLAGLVVRAAFDLLVPKVVVCEDFSNFACIPCPPADAALQAVLGEMEPGRAVSFNPHLPFPGVGDPFYQLNQAAHDARWRYFYLVTSAPTIVFDGAARLVGEAAWSTVNIRGAIEPLLAASPPLAIGVRTTLGTGDYRVTVDVWGVAEGIPSNLALFTCVVEREVTLDPPGPNGQGEYRNVLRSLHPAPAGQGGTGGQPLGEIGRGERRMFDYTYVLQAGVDPAQLGAIAFAQENGGSRSVVQTGTSFSP